MFVHLAGLHLSELLNQFLHGEGRKLVDVDGFDSWALLCGSASLPSADGQVWDNGDAGSTLHSQNAQWTGAFARSTLGQEEEPCRLRQRPIHSTGDDLELERARRRDVHGLSHHGIDHAPLTTEKISHNSRSTRARARGAPKLTRLEKSANTPKSELESLRIIMVHQPTFQVLPKPLICSYPGGASDMGLDRGLRTVFSYTNSGSLHQRTCECSWRRTLGSGLRHCYSCTSWSQLKTDMGSKDLGLVTFYSNRLYYAASRLRFAASRL